MAGSSPERMRASTVVMYRRLTIAPRRIETKKIRINITVMTDRIPRGIIIGPPALISWSKLAGCAGSAASCAKSGVARTRKRSVAGTVFMKWR